MVVPYPLGYTRERGKGVILRLTRDQIAQWFALYNQHVYPRAVLVETTVPALLVLYGHCSMLLLLLWCIPWLRGYSIPEELWVDIVLPPTQHPINCTSRDLCAGSFFLVHRKHGANTHTHTDAVSVAVTKRRA